ncbi:CYTH domain-containing protein (plasmid) [Rhizobium sp. T1470]|uniref:CYTH domain-containing protein n=1 Tax=unclassified Rhizobium TaxID=2613769 RepID=UPI001AAFAD8C|nr:CYTH domain-containing protein [Rhizobium sp. T1473]MCA0806916.1 CYTH domain-containing protein [Rhizobium sp. T1473]
MKTIEIERKFLVRNDAWRASVTSSHEIRQGYLTRGRENSVRVRTVDGLSARLTVKFGKRGLSREEYEYDIPYAEAVELLSHAIGGIVEKTRYTVPHRGVVWEVDVFGGRHDGLTIGEIELNSEESNPSIPKWLSREVTGDKRYSNRSLATSTLAIALNAGSPATTTARQKPSGSYQD